jgi:hypothetical protein
MTRGPACTSYFETGIDKVSVESTRILATHINKRTMKEKWRGEMAIKKEKLCGALRFLNLRDLKWMSMKKNQVCEKFFLG